MVFPNTIRGIIETGRCAIENFSGLHEWYSIVMNGISKYHFGIIETGTGSVGLPLRMSVVLNGIQW